MNPTMKLQFRVHKEDDGTTIKWHYILQQYWESPYVYRSTNLPVPGEWRDVPTAPYVPVVIS
jgi:hypothetical protein